MTELSLQISSECFPQDLDKYLFLQKLFSVLIVISALIGSSSLNCSSQFCSCQHLQCVEMLCQCWLSCLPFAPLPILSPFLIIFCCLHSLFGFFVGYLLPCCCLSDLTVLAHISLYCLSIEHHLESAMLSKVIVFTGQSIRMRDKDCLAKAVTFIMINTLSYSSQ